MIMYAITLQDVTNRDYLIQRLPARSSRREIDTGEVLDAFSSILTREKVLWQFFYQTLMPLLETDFSTVRPSFEMKSETSLMEIEKVSEHIILTGMIKRDFITKMPPTSLQTVRVRVKKIEKATPHIVEPEGV